MFSLRVTWQLPATSSGRLSGRYQSQILRTVALSPRLPGTRSLERRRSSVQFKMPGGVAPSQVSCRPPQADQLALEGAVS
eukprot:3518703-Rhodomonas_salina.4